MKESGTNENDVLQKAQDLYVLKTPKKSQFLFLYCWQMKKKVPRWMNIHKETKNTTRVQLGGEGSNDKRSLCSKSFNEVDLEVQGLNETVEVGVLDGGLHLKHPRGIKKAKTTLQFAKIHEEAMKASAAATSEMAEATRQKTQILANQHAMEVMTMPDELIKIDEAREYMKLRRQEEITNLRHRIASRAMSKASIHMARDAIEDIVEVGLEKEDGLLDLNKGFTYGEPLELE